MAASPNFDRYGKRGLEGLLSPYGQATSDKTTEVAPHAIDLFFQPGSNASQAPAGLGLLGELIQRPTLLEPFSTAPTLDRLSGCVLKLHSVWAELRTAAARRAAALRQAGQESPGRAERVLAHEARRPHLVVFLPWAGKRLIHTICSGSPLQTARASKIPLPGLYATSRLYRTTLVVCEQLPPVPRTLFVRLLFGRGQTLIQAWQEFQAGYEGQPIFQYLLQQAISDSILLNTHARPSRDLQRQQEEYRMLWSTLTRDYHQEHLDQTQQLIQEERQKAEAERRILFAALLQARLPGINGELDPLLSWLCTLPFSQAMRYASQCSLAELLELEGTSH